MAFSFRVEEGYSSLLVTKAEEEKFMSDEEWNKFEKMVKEQLKKGEYTSYIDFEKAKEHSRRLRN